MSLEIWLAYALATEILLVIPGPTVMLVVSYGLAEGRRAALATTLGVGLGDLTAVVLAFAGLGALLAASAELFQALKWLGAAYLVWLGVKMWRSDPAPPEASAADASLRSRRAMVAHAWAVTALNPKSYVFFVAFLPQFVDPAQALLPQMLVLGATFVALAMVNAGLYGWLSGGVRGVIRRPGLLRAVNRVGAGMLVSAGLAMAALRRAA